MQAGVARRSEELTAPEVVDLPVAANENRRNRELTAVRRLGAVVVVVGRLGRGEQADVPPAALRRMLLELRDRFLPGEARLASKNCSFGTHSAQTCDGFAGSIEE